MRGTITSLCLSLGVLLGHPSAFGQTAVSSARGLNKAGLSARRAHRNADAARLYARALNVDARYVPARYNLACELALAGHTDAALGHLDTLRSFGTAEAYYYVAKAPLDSDFAAIRSTPRFVAMQRRLDLDPSRPVLAQLCANPARAVRLIHPKAGLLQWTDITDVADDSGGVRKARIRKGFSGFKAVLSALASFCVKGRVVTEDGMGPGAVRDGALPPSGSRLRCIDQPGYGEYSTNGEICFATDAHRRWRIAFVSSTDSGELVDDPMFMPRIAARQAKQRRRAAARIYKAR